MNEILEETAKEAYTALTSEDAREADDLAPTARRAKARNFLLHMISLAASKTGDSLIQPKFTLTALLSAMGASQAAVGALVPVRESLSMLPQFLESGPIERMRRRKHVWAAGAVGQGLAVAGMGLTALALPNALGGWIILALLAVFALSRSFCSVSYKDVLGVTVAKGARGTVTGTAGMIAAAMALLFGALLVIGVLPQSIPAIAGVLFVAAGIWIIAGLVFTRVKEPHRDPGETTGWSPFAAFRHFKTDPQLWVFFRTRALLVATAIAPPFLMVAAGQDKDILSVLGPFILSASAAGFLSNYVWGRLADVSSRKVLIFSGIVAALALGVAAILSFVELSGALRLGVYTGLLFVLLIAYEGVRLGRSVHLVDMAEEDKRADYTAATNTLMGLVLLASIGFGVLGSLIGTKALLGLFAIMSAASVVSALGLNEVQSDTD